MQLLEADIDGPVAYADFGGDGPPVVLVHGLGGNHANWMAAAPLFTQVGRVLAPDLPGFGRTPPHGRTSSVHDNRRILHRFITEVAGGRAVLMGNSMGGLLSLMQAAAAPETVASLVLVSPALPRPPRTIGDPLIVATFAAYSMPFAGERLVAARSRRLGPEGLVRETLRVCTVDPARVPETVVAELIEIARWRFNQPWAPTAYLQAARSLVSVVARRAKFRQMIESIEAPGLIVHGRHDRLVPLAASREIVAMRPGWVLEVFEDSGHIAMMEHGDRFAEAALRWVRDQDLRHAPGA
ncbi:MAG TPA: alpha/beta hydrolase [Actinomycetota bacterium]|nr:alpha/beta hydrolase [Actinomycetota bacterium]